MLGEELQRGELRGAGDHQRRSSPCVSASAPARLGGQHPEEHAERARSPAGTAARRARPSQKARRIVDSVIALSRRLRARSSAPPRRRPSAALSLARRLHYRAGRNQPGRSHATRLPDRPRPCGAAADPGGRRASTTRAARVETRVVEERPLTIFLNAQEIVTAMTIGDYPEYLARRLPAEPGHARGATTSITGDRLRRRARDRGGPHRSAPPTTRRSSGRRPAPRAAPSARSSAT